MACGAPRARWRGVAEVEVVGASRGRASEARGGRWPRLWRSHGDGGARLRRGTKGSAVDLRGKAQGPRGEWGRVGGETEGARRRRPYPLVSSPARGVRLGRALFRPGSGEQGKGTRCGSWAGWAGQAGCGPGGLGCLPVSGLCSGHGAHSFWQLLPGWRPMPPSLSPSEKADKEKKLTHHLGFLEGVGRTCHF